MNIFSATVSALKTARWLADGLGMCKGCHIRKRGLILECESCGANLCAACSLAMVKRHTYHNEMMKNANRPPTNILICEACGKKWGEVK